jgi:hypothetical protein
VETTNPFQRAEVLTTRLASTSGCSHILSTWRPRNSFYRKKHLKKYSKTLHNICALFSWIPPFVGFISRLFRKIRHFCRPYVRPSVRIKKLGSLWTDFYKIRYFSHICSVHLDVIKSSFCPTERTNKLLQNNVKIYIKSAPTCFGLTTIIRELTVCNLLKLYLQN